MNQIKIADAQKLLDDLASAWSRNNGADFGAPFLKDAHFVAFDGTVLNGRDAIGEYHQAAFDRYLKDTRLVASIESTCAVGRDTLLAFTRGHIEGATGGTVQLSGDSLSTMLVVLRDGKARIQAFQNTRNRPITGDASAQVWREFDRMWNALK
jgi:uncharacterized protein (TIGR02246 family)